MSLSEAEKQKYVDTSGMHCPYCGSTQMSVGEPQMDGPCAWCDIECDDCGKSWTDDYALVGITEDK